MKIVNTIAAGLVLVSLVAAGTADARGRSSFRSVQGAYGRDYETSRTAIRGNGSATVTRNAQTNGGYGVSTTRNRSVPDGTYASDVTHMTNNGTTRGRTTTATANGGLPRRAPFDPARRHDLLP